ncbi:MAG: multifunctional CCA addition/repair protein [Pseudomonadota bacterium]
MKKFLVGGAVRDRLLGYPVKERDWVVVGETPEAMIKRGFRAVGKDFPVFLHPTTFEEYALARTERKTGPGYRGFCVTASPEVTLEQDLRRRDLTINAMAEDDAGRLIDPYGGSRDLADRVLRHVSPAFSEDPVRILRVARFAARYAHLGFCVAGETSALMRQMVESGEVDALVPERVWTELDCALAEKTPGAFFQVLRECGALAPIFPEIDRLFGVPQPAKHHPEVDTGRHLLLALEQASALTEDPVVRFAVLTHDLGKGVTPPDSWPYHHGHERAGLPVLDAFCARLRVPNAYKKLAVNVMRYHTLCHRALELRPSTLTDTLAGLGALKPNSTLEPFLLACEADARGRTSFENRPYPQADLFRMAQLAALTVRPEEAIKRGLRGAEIGKEVRRLRIAAVAACKKGFRIQSKAAT